MQEVEYRCIVCGRTFKDGNVRRHLINYHFVPLNLTAEYYEICRGE